MTFGRRVLVLIAFIAVAIGLLRLLQATLRFDLSIVHNNHHGQNIPFTVQASFLSAAISIAWVAFEALRYIRKGRQK